MGNKSATTRIEVGLLEFILAVGFLLTFNPIKTYSVDHYKAKQLETLLKGKTFRGLTIEMLINNGKSAAVFLSNDLQGKKVALKIFDNEMIDRFGHEVQEKRIQQEIALKGHHIPNLINILDGGQEDIDGKSYFFISMAYVEGVNLKDYIEKNIIDSKFVKQVVLTLYNTTEALLDLGIAHRDIKPENIMISFSKEVILMDLGVIKLIGTASFSDLEDKQFVGTLRYAPPEFLTRTEGDSFQGWQAINRYQIGAVMHDLIMKKELYSGIAPYSNLVIAIKEDAPVISSDLFQFETIQLARDLLIKNCMIRINLTPAIRINNWAKTIEQEANDISKELEELFQRSSGHKAKLQEIENITRSTNEKKDIRIAIAKKIEKFVKECFTLLKEKGGCQNWSEDSGFNFNLDSTLRNNFEVRNLLFQISGDLNNGFSQPLYVLIRFQNNEHSEGTIGLLGILLSRTFSKSNQTTPLDVFRHLNSEKPQDRNVINQIHIGNQPVNFNEPVYTFINGTIGLDEQLANKFLITIIKIIKKATQLMEAEVQFQLSIREQTAKGERGSFLRVVDSKSKLIYELD